ncbi:MAG TPA: formate-dependent phosphoribosylglycinamide formyltransferase, partial [Rhizomicrobium sp.]|nr:formate-dependent phosphoribosylglycinamide formyltransferase [Rhizomicrobium sp.]
GKEVIIELQRLGVETIAVDRYPNAPAHQVAHRAYVIDMTDAEALRGVVELEKPHLVVPEIEALATDELVRIEADGLCAVIPTARAAHITMNRERIRVLAAEELRLPTSPYAFASSLEELQAACARTGFPCFVKPVMSSSGKGQSRLRSAEDVAAAWEKALSAGRVREARVIVEGEIRFDFEITQLTVRAADGTHFCEPIGHVQKDGDYVESWQPQPMSEIARAKGREMAAQVTAALGGLGIFGVELFVKGDEVWFSEVSPRPHDTGLVTLVSQHLSEFALHARAILGLPVSTEMASAGASAVICGGVEAGALTFEGVDEALKIPGSELRLFGKPQSFVKRRMGVALVRATTTQEACARAKKIAACVKPIVYLSH